MELMEIGLVRHDFNDDYVRDHPRELQGTIEIFDKFSEGLAGLKENSYIFVIAIMHRHVNEKYPLKIRPRLLLRKGYELKDLPEMGVFASDSPSRPNPLGLSLLRLDEIHDNMLRVHGLDLFNGTPIIDVKPFGRKYQPSDFKQINDRSVCDP